MGGLLKNVFVSAGIVVAGTAATSGAAMALFLIYTCASTNNYDMLLYGSAPAVIMGVAIGIFFSIASLFVAAVTMPPLLGLAHAFKLPRPATDMFGGAAAGAFCASLVLELFESLARSKGGSPPDDVTTYWVVSVGVLGGLLTGYWRYVALVRGPVHPPAELVAA
jgi:hypothetical protein